MKLETIKKYKKKKIIIGSMVVLSVFGCLTITTTRAKYRSVQSLKLASGTINYSAPDLKLAIKVSEDGETYTSRTDIPTSGYTFNTEKSKCRIPTSTLTGENAPVAEGITMEYTDGKVNVLGVTKNNTKCYMYFDKKLSISSEDTIAKLNVQNIKEGTPDFTQVATGTETKDNNGIYKVEDGMYRGYSYYWRGAVTTNHVIFDNKCWRIVRINGDGSIRLIYSGTPTNNTCPGNGSNSAAVIMGSSNSEKYYATSDGLYDNSYYVGWTYDASQRTLAGVDSNVKSQTEKWYNNNISVNEKIKVDSKGKFCNDRSIGVPSSWNGYVMDWSANGTQFAYAATKRLREDYNPSLSCNEGDTYNLSVGSITADEVMFAGGKIENDNSGDDNTYYYLHTNKNYWTMSPYRWNGSSAWVFIVNSSGRLAFINVNSTGYGFRPVINLLPSVTFNLGSDGTQNNPYIVQ